MDPKDMVPVIAQPVTDLLVSLSYQRILAFDRDASGTSQGMEIPGQTQDLLERLSHSWLGNL